MSIVGYTYCAGALLLLAAATATGCTEKLDTAGPDPICIEAKIDAPATDAQSTQTTRTTMTGSTASFAAGDNIGVFETLTGRANVQYAYNGSAWTTSTPMYWRNGTSSHTFYAYYPYTGAYSGTTVSIPVLSTQTMSTAPSAACDLLVAGPLSQTRSAGVGLTFKHAFSLIQLNVKMGIAGLLNPYTLNRITIRGGNTAGGSSPYGIANVTGNYAQVGYNLATNSVVAATNDAQSYIQSFYSDITGVSLFTTSISLYAIVLPGTYTNPVPAISFRVTLLILTSNSTYVNFSNTTFQPGTKYVYEVSIGKLLRSSEKELDITLEPREIVPLDEAATDINKLQPINSLQL